jgi:Uma2 family endonuclease
MPVTEPRTFHWTREEYHRLADQGFFQDRRVELIEGEIVEMPVPKPPHVMALGLTEDVLRTAFGRGFWVRTQAPLNLGEASEPEPDLAVVPGGPWDYPEHPTTALLVVEISETTPPIDRGRKASLYARAGLADYWIINLVDRQLEVCRTPGPDASQPHGFGYQGVTILDATESVAPLAAPGARIAVADLLP